MQFNSIILFISGIVGMFSTCVGGDITNSYTSVALEVSNESGSPIEILTWRTDDGSVLKPDIFEVDYFPELVRIIPHQTLRFDDVAGYNETAESHTTVQVLVFEEQTLQNYTHREIIENNIYDKVFIFGQRDIQFEKHSAIFAATYYGKKNSNKNR